MKKIKLDNKIAVTILLFSVLAVYWGVWNGFFQQDEWKGLGSFFARNTENIVVLFGDLYSSVFKLGVAHFLPWVPPVNHLRYALFGLSYEPYAVFSLATHAVITVLVYFLALKVTSKKTASFIGALFFGVAVTASQSVIWVGTSIPTQFAVLFAILSIHQWLIWLDTKKRVPLFFSVVSAVLAIGFKETGLLLFVLLPVLGALYEPTRRTLYFKSLFIAGGAYALFRYVLLIPTFGVIDGFATVLALLANAANNFFLVLTRGFVLQLVPQDMVLRFETKGILLIVAGIVLIGALVLYAWRQKGQKARAYWTAILFILFAFLPLAFLPSIEIESTFLPPRSYYMPLVGVGVLTAVILKYSYSKLLVGLLIGLMALHVYHLRADIMHFNELGDLRTRILRSISLRYPDLPAKAVFFIESNRVYYGLAAGSEAVPFQSGFGQTLLVWYSPDNAFPKSFYSNNFLWEITSQGYKEEENRGFGYFRKRDELENAISEYSIKPESVIAFNWNGVTEVLTDVTDQLRRELYDENNQ